MPLGKLETVATEKPDFMRSLIKFTTIAAVSTGSAQADKWLASIKGQQHKNWEAILVEYGQGAGRVLCWSSHSAKPIHKAIKLPSSKNDALNIGLSMACGDVICLLPCHCEYKDALVFAKVAQCMEEPELDLVCGDIEFKKPSGELVVSSPTTMDGRFNDRSGQFLLPHEECLFVRQDWWRFFGGLETSYPRSALLARALDMVSQPGMQTRYLNEVLVASNEIEPSIAALSPSQLLEEIRIFSRRGLLLSYLKGKSVRIRGKHGKPSRDPALT